MFSSLLTLLLAPALGFAFTLTTSNMKGWSKEEVKFRFNPASCGSNVSRVEDAVRSAVDLWNAVSTSEMRVTYMGQTTGTGLAEDPIVACVTSGISGSVGVGTITTLSGVIQSAGIEMNMETSDSGNIGSISDGQLRVALAHEMGHVFGIGHSTVETALMYYSLGQKTEMRLSQDDIDGITWLYGRNEPEDGVMGCGTLGVGENGGAGGGGGGLLWVLALALAATVALRGRRGSTKGLRPATAG